MKVLFHYDCGDGVGSELASLAARGLDVTACPESDAARFLALLPATEVLWHALKPVTHAVIAQAPKLRLIQKIGVGVNTIDLEAARARGIAVCNMPGTNSRAVAELTLALMLAALRRLPAFDAATRAGRGWSWPATWQDDLTEIAGKTVGLVGFGSIPRLLAPVLEAMGAEVIYTSRSPAADARYQHLPKAEFLRRADIVSLHIPLTPETEHYLDRAALAAMRPGAVVVNTARGALIDEAALVEALCSGHIRAAGLDVFAAEPTAPDNPLFALQNVVLTPHVAWITRETLTRSLAVAAENCHRLKSGADLLHRVC